MDVEGGFAFSPRLGIRGTTFIQAYNRQRHAETASLNERTNENGGSTFVPISPISVPSKSKPTNVKAGGMSARSMALSAAGMRPGASPPKMGFASKLLDSKRGGYHLIRSDVDDDEQRSAYDVNDRVIPSMPDHSLGINHRQVLHIHHGPQDQVDDGNFLAWVDADWFHGISGAVIICNAIIIGLETDIQSEMWFWVEHSLLSYFVFELIVRLIRLGVCLFFSHEEDWVWNLFDFGIVMSGVCDQWLMPLVRQLMKANAQEESGGMSSIFMVMRMARLLRIVRLFRLVRIVRPLHDLALSVLEALQGMFWVLVFMVMTLYSVAILCTRIIGQGSLITEAAQNDKTLQEIQSMFKSVDASMFTLFGTVSSWSLMRFVPLFKDIPVLRPLFVVFYIYSAWALLAVMTGVVSENMIAIREQMMKEDEQREEMRKSMITKLLMELFREADVDNSNTITRNEFEGMLRSPEIVKKITKNSRMKVQDLKDLFEWIDHDGGGTITIDEFMTGFKWINEPLRAKSLVKLQERLAKELNNLEQSVKGVVETRAAEVQKMVAIPLRKVHAIAEQMQSLDVHLSKMRTSIKIRADGLPTQEQFRSMEERLNARLSKTVAKLDQIEQAASSTLHRRNLLRTEG
eukprot:TRINITY_DN37453_c0_g1_i1.p1 TRINITY_DN37453_c0_g1~~TRINITY_DN37453_c0_g1_i1.p1  ORF type:complete len:631 (+),score=111.32 TRINITY_DN37453_c0_g1_i1:154-2046(+)